jgi:hypothetical protein
MLATVRRQTFDQTRARAARHVAQELEREFEAEQYEFEEEDYREYNDNAFFPKKSQMYVFGCV